MMHGAADEPVRVELAAKGDQLAAGTFAQDGLNDTQSTSKTCDDSAYGGNFYLSGGVADQIHVAVADLALDGNPAAVFRNSCALPFERLHAFALKEAFHALGSVTPVDADDT